MEAAVTYKSNWWGYISKKVFIVVIAFFVISFSTFYILHSYEPPIMSDPPPQSEAEYEKIVEQMEQIRERLGLTQPPLIIQYFHWMGDFFTGNWGESLRY
jgi:ABC-type dipeptide/oligopeptide/nickel transport system permease component